MTGLNCQRYSADKLYNRKGDCFMCAPCKACTINVNKIYNVKPHRIGIVSKLPGPLAGIHYWFGPYENTREQTIDKIFS